MKKTICFLLCLVTVLFCGCRAHTGDDQVQSSFFYLRDPDTYHYGSPEGVISSELRDITGHENELNYLLMLYLKGPLDEALESPFPEGCSILQLTVQAGKLSVTLNPSFATLKGMDLTLACVCLARTCFSLTDVQSIRISAQDVNGTVTVDETITINSLLLEETELPSESGE